VGLSLIYSGQLINVTACRVYNACRIFYFGNGGFYTFSNGRGRNSGHVGDSVYRRRLVADFGQMKKMRKG
jgi:hypothetical protein